MLVGEAHSTYMQKSGGQSIPDDWRLPILFKMIPKPQMDDIKMSHKYAKGEENKYPAFSRMLVERVGEAVRGQGERQRRHGCGQR